MAIILSLAAAIVYGVADFTGGLMSKRNDVYRVVLLSQLFGTLPFALVFPLINDGVVSTSALVWGMGAGFGGATGVVLLYRGLAVGRMSVVAPITAVEAAAFPVLYGLARGERPNALALVGVATALIAVWIISSAGDEEGGRPSRSGVPEALGAGAAFGVFFIFLGEAPEGSGMWPLMAVRATSIALVAVAALITRTSMRPAPGTTWGIALAGLLDVAANIFYLLSTRYGLLSLVAVITSLYPAMTVLMARIVLKERLVKTQIAGLGLAVVGVVLIAGG